MFAIMKRKGTQVAFSRQTGMPTSKATLFFTSSLCMLEILNLATRKKCVAFTLYSV